MKYSTMQALGLSPRDCLYWGPEDFAAWLVERLGQPLDKAETTRAAAIWVDLEGEIAEAWRRRGPDLVRALLRMLTLTNQPEIHKPGRKAEGWTAARGLAVRVLLSAGIGAGRKSYPKGERWRNP